MSALRGLASLIRVRPNTDAEVAALLDALQQTADADERARFRAMLLGGEVS